MRFKGHKPYAEAFMGRIVRLNSIRPLKAAIDGGERLREADINRSTVTAAAH